MRRAVGRAGGKVRVGTRWRRISDVRGFSLPEVVVAVVVLSVGVLAVAGLISASLETIARARAMDAVTLRLESAVDSLIAAGFVEDGGTDLSSGGRVSWEEVDLEGWGTRPEGEEDEDEGRGDRWGRVVEVRVRLDHESERPEGRVLMHVPPAPGG